MVLANQEYPLFHRADQETILSVLRKPKISTLSFKIAALHSLSLSQRWHACFAFVCRKHSPVYLAHELRAHHASWNRDDQRLESRSVAFPRAAAATADRWAALCLSAFLCVYENAPAVGSGFSSQRFVLFIACSARGFYCAYFCSGSCQNRLAQLP